MGPKPAKPPRPQVDGLDDEVFQSRATYVVGWSAAGVMFGAMAMLRIGPDELNPLMTLFASSVGGGLVGFELHATRDWADRGELLNLGRWAMAFTSAAAVVGSVWRVFGVISVGEFYLLLIAGAVAGAGLHLYLDRGR